MSKSELQFMVEGPDAEKVAGELANQFQRQFDQTVTLTPLRKNGLPEPGKKVTPDWLDTGLKAAGFLVSLPAVAVAVTTLREKLAARSGMEKVREQTRQLTETHPGTQVRVVKPDGTLVDFFHLSPDQVMDMFREVNR